MVVNRIDLDDQHMLVLTIRRFLASDTRYRQEQEHLKSLLDGRSANGIIFTTMFKFEPMENFVRTQKRVVMADEHIVGGMGFDEKSLCQRMKTVKGAHA